MIQKVSHIGIVVRDLDAAVRLWTGTFGLTEYRRIDIPVEGIRSAFLSPGGTPDEMTIEILQPLDPEDMQNPVARRLARSGEGFYHLAVEVDDVAGSGRTLAAAGLTVLERGPAARGEDARWLVHPKDANGVMVEGIRRGALRGLRDAPDA